MHICSTLLLAYVLYGSCSGCSIRQSAEKLGLDAALVVGVDWTTAGRQIPRLGMAPDLPVDAPPISVEDTWAGLVLEGSYHTKHMGLSDRFV